MVDHDQNSEELKNEVVEMRQAIADLEQRLEIRGFFKRLSKEDDWSFVVHLQAFIETGINTLLEKRFNIPAMESFWRDLTFNGGAASKLSLIRSLGLLFPETSNLITAICSVRNRFVHHASNVNITLADYLSKLAPNKVAELKRPFREVVRDETVDTDFRTTLWTASFVILSEISVRIETQEIKAKGEAIEREILERQREIEKLRVEKKRELELLEALQNSNALKILSGST